MYISATLASTLFFAAVRACIECPHPGNFTGNLLPYEVLQSASCGIESAPPNATYAKLSKDYFNPPDESPCNAPITVTNPKTNKIVTAYVVGECKTCSGDDVYLSQPGYSVLSKRRRKPYTAVEWTFA